MKKKVIATTILSAAILGSLTGCGGVKTTDDSVVSTGQPRRQQRRKRKQRPQKKRQREKQLLPFGTA